MAPDIATPWTLPTTPTSEVAVGILTGTAAEVTPVREVDHRQIGNGKRGPITQQLQQAYFDVVAGREPRYHGYLTYL